MTAVNLIVKQSAAFLLTDGAVCEQATGSLSFVTSKIWPLPHINAVIAFRGNLQVVPFVFANLASLFPSFDHMKLSLGVTWRSLFLN